MKRLIAILFVLVFVGCDDRPPGAYDNGSFEHPIKATSMEYNGIRYLFMHSANTEAKGWTVDYSQFFTQDTLVVNGEVWIRVGSEQEVKTSGKVPQLKDGQ